MAKLSPEDLRAAAGRFRIRLTIGTMRGSDGVALRYSTARQIIESADEVREFLPEEAAEIIAEAGSVAQGEAVRDYHTPDEGAAAWIARLVRSMRTGLPPHKGNAAWRLFQNRALVREFRPADGDKIVWEAASLAHAEATRSVIAKGGPSPPGLLLPTAATAAR